MKEMDKLEDIKDKYADIINLPHHVSKKHPRMSLEARSAQFAPYAALNGHAEAVNNTAHEHIDKIEEENSNEEFED